MIIKLLPEQIVKIWDMLRFAIAETFLPRITCTNEHLSYVLSCLLAGSMQCWIVFEGTPENKTFIGFMVTRIGIDPALKEKTLYLDCVYAYRSVADSLLTQSAVTLDKFAKLNNCGSIQTVTESEKIVSLAVRNGYTKRFQLIKEV